MIGALKEWSEDWCLAVRGRGRLTPMVAVIKDRRSRRDDGRGQNATTA
jgi:hypothetical protein